VELWRDCKVNNGDTGVAVDAQFVMEVRGMSTEQAIEQAKGLLETLNATRKTDAIMALHHALLEFLNAYGIFPEG
jgi:hypothetical protein